MNQHADIVVIHPSPFMVDVVNQLLLKLAPDLTVKNVIIEDMLARAQQGIGTEMITEMSNVIQQIKKDGAGAVMCSCSTLGGIAEELGSRHGLPVIRIDRPMAEAAVSMGKKIGVAAALESTVGPTSDLLVEIAQKAGIEIELHVILCPKAWSLKQSGDNHGYIQSVAEEIRQQAAGLDVIVLAQGSMASAAELLSDLRIPVLSSPVMGCEAIIKAARTTKSNFSVY